MSRCPDIDSLLDRACDAEVEAHVGDCEACGALAALRDVRSSWPGRGASDSSCERFELDIAAMADGVADPARLRDLLAHAAVCPSCDRVAARVGMFRSELEAVPLPAFPGPSPMTDAPRHTADARTGSITLPLPTRTRRTHRSRWAWAAAIMAAAVAAAACVWLGVALRDRAVPQVVASAVSVEPVAAAPAPLAVLPPSSMASEQPPVPAAPSAASAPRRPGPVLSSSPPPPVGIDQGYLSVACAPGCDDVQIDGASAGPAPVLKRRVAVGRHEVTLRLGAEERHLAAVVAQDRTTALHVQMEGSGLVDPFAQRGFLTILCSPFCESVELDGRSLGPSPIVRHATSPGAHLVTLIRTGQRKVARVSINSGETTSLRISMSGDDLP